MDTYAAMGFDAEGAKTLMPAFMDITTMRASGKYTPIQLRDSVIQKVKDGRYKAPSRIGICYLLSPLLRGRLDNGVVNMVMPHYRFYAPNLADIDVGGKWVTGGHQPFVANSGTALDNSHSIFNFIILAAGETEKEKIIEEHKDLLRRLAEYKAFFEIETSNMEHEHTQSQSPENLIKSFFAGFEKKDWNMVAAQLAEGFTFTSPNNDDHITLVQYKEKCWATGSKFFKHIEFTKIVVDDNSSTGNVNKD